MRTGSGQDTEILSCYLLLSTGSALICRIWKFSGSQGGGLVPLRHIPKSTIGNLCWGPDPRSWVGPGGYWLGNSLEQLRVYRGHGECTCALCLILATNGVCRHLSRYSQEQPRLCSQGDCEWNFTPHCQQDLAGTQCRNSPEWSQAAKRMHRHMGEEHRRFSCHHSKS